MQTNGNRVEQASKEAYRMRITGKITVKQYQCQTCKTVSKHSTNHYGEIYLNCNNCGAGEIRVLECTELLPEGWSRPEPWKIVKLSEIAKIVG